MAPKLLSTNIDQLRCSIVQFDQIHESKESLSVPSDNCSLLDELLNKLFSKIAANSIFCSKRKSHKSTTHFSSIFIALLSFIIIQSTIFINSANCHPVSSLHMCHGLQQGSKYTYNYDTLMLLNNHDHKVNTFPHQFDNE